MSYPKASFEMIRIPGNSGCLEVYVNDKVIHSKKKGDGVPKNQDLLMKIENIIGA